MRIGELSKGTGYQPRASAMPLRLRLLEAYHIDSSQGGFEPQGITRHPSTRQVLRTRREFVNRVASFSGGEEAGYGFASNPPCGLCMTFRADHPR
jgi:hypothetical protein